MTVLQQVKDYYDRFAQPSNRLAREVVQKIIAPQSVKPTPASADNLSLTDKNHATGLSPNRGRFLSQDI
jgi:hypothetical protein